MIYFFVNNLVKYIIYNHNTVFFIFVQGEEVKEVENESKVEDFRQEEAFEDERDETNDEKVTDEDESADEETQEVQEKDQNESNLCYFSCSSSLK